MKMKKLPEEHYIKGKKKSILKDISLSPSPKMNVFKQILLYLKDETSENIREL